MSVVDFLLAGQGSDVATSIADRMALDACLRLGCPSSCVSGALATAELGVPGPRSMTASGSLRLRELEPEASLNFALLDELMRCSARHRPGPSGHSESVLDSDGMAGRALLRPGDSKSECQWLASNYYPRTRRPPGPVSPQSGMDHDESLSVPQAYVQAQHHDASAGPGGGSWPDSGARPGVALGHWQAATTGLQVAPLARLAGVIADWLHFAHHGEVTLTTPSWWILAWAGYPFHPWVVECLRTRAGGDAALAHKWLEKYAEVGLEAFAEWLGDTVTVLTSSCFSKADDVLRRMVLDWVATTAAEVVPWKRWYCGDGRDASFGAVESLLRHGAGGVTLGRLEPVSLPVERLLQVEAAMGTRLPGDLRRILLQVGDVGRILFGSQVRAVWHMVLTR
jgi:hypothetical protein